MNKNVEKYRKALDSIKVSDSLKEKTLKKVLIKEEVYKKDKRIEKRSFNKLMYPVTTVLACLLIIFSTVLVNGKLGQKNAIIEDVINNQEMQIAYQEKDILPKVGSIENLNKLLGNLEITYTDSDDLMEETSDKHLAADSSSNFNDSNATTTSKTHSTTNVQVEGIDEADIIKTDGDYIYYIANKKLYIVNVKNPENMIVENISKYDEDIAPKELYIRNNEIVLILDKSSINKYESDGRMICFDIAATNSETIVITYELRGELKLVEKRRIEMEGRYLDSRRIGSEIYFITTKYVYNKDENVVPEYLDTVKGNEKHQVDVENMLYVPESENSNFLIIVGFDLENSKEANIKTLLGAGEEIYCTDTNLYITSTKYQDKDKGYKTNIYKFKLIDTNIISKAVVEVKGRPLTQFSMSEYNNQFNIVTTNEVWKNKNIVTKNDLYVFDEELKQIGKLEKIGGDESLKSVRFMGDKAYVVTFEKTDPLFVIDISNGEEPKILGELKIPGYSTYLHPYDENTLIGIGKEVKIERRYYGEIEVNVGVKVSIFDVSDFSNPKELHTLILDDKSYSNVEYNHKAVLFSKEKNLLAFPITRFDEKDKETKNEYLVLSIDLENGISIKKRISHGYNETEYGKYMVEVNRGLYIDNNLYTLSSKKIEVRDLEKLEKISEVEL